MHRQKTSIHTFARLLLRKQITLIGGNDFNRKPFFRKRRAAHNPKSLQRMLINIDWFLIVFESFFFRLSCWSIENWVFWEGGGRGFVFWKMSSKDVQQMINASIDWPDPWLTDKDIRNWIQSERLKAYPKFSSSWIALGDLETWEFKWISKKSEREKFKA